MGKPVFSSHSKCIEIARAIALCLFFVTGLAIAGCGGPKVTPRVVDIKDGVQQDEEAKIKGYLVAAGINGQIVSIQNDAKEWLVDVGAPAPKPGQRQSAVAPNTVRVDKASGKVTTGLQGG